MSVIRDGGALTKTATFACVHFTVAFSIAYLLTGSMAISGTLALLEPMANTVAYYLHERVWRRMERREQTGSAAAATAV
jgi:uncharacterized membrane protein